MPLDPGVERFLKLLGAAADGVAFEDVAARRAGLADMLRLSGPQVPAIVEDRTLAGPAGGLRVRVLTPADAADSMLPGLVFFHGGGLVAGTVATHEAIARAIARAGRCRVVSVEYRLGPEARFPAAVDDALAAVRAIRDDPAAFGIDAANLGVCGDSAGGTLAAVVCNELANDRERPLALQVLLCPILDHSRPTDSRKALASGYLVGRATLDHDLAHYLPPGADLADPRISPLRAATLRGVPPTIIHTAEFDPLRDEGREYFERLDREGVRVSYTCHPGMIHLFYGLGAVISYARIAFERIGADIRAAWH